MTRVIAALELQARRLALRKNLLAAAVGGGNAISMWRMHELDRAERASIELAWFVMCVTSALLLALALRAHHQLRVVEEEIRQLRDSRREPPLP